MGFNEFISKLFGNKATRDMKEIQPWVNKVKEVYPEIAKLSHDELRAKTEELKKYIKESAVEENKKIEELKATIETTDIEKREPIFSQIDKLEKEVLEKYEKALNDVLPTAFAIVKDTARRLSENEEIEVTATEMDRNLAAQGKDFVRIEGDKAIWKNHWVAGGNEMTWNMVHYDVQLFGGVVLHQGKIAEMATGEGKTLVATLPVFLNALTGNGVHVVTVNDYLAKRDSEWMGPLYMFHGLSVDCIDKHQPNSEARRRAYMADITFGTNNEFGFDYLRDNMAVSPRDLVQRKHNYAIVDEVDSVLIDDARTPLIISGPVPKGDEQLFEVLRPLVERLVEAQRKLATQYLADAKRLIASDKKEDVEAGFLALFRSHKALPKNKPLIKYLSEPGIKAGMLKTEEIYMEQNNKRMPEAVEPLYFVIDEKLKSVDLTDKGVDLITGNSQDPTRLYLFQTPCGILGHGLPQLLHAELHVVEIGDGLTQLLRKVGQHGFKLAELHAHQIGRFRCHGLQRLRFGNEHADTPVMFPVEIISFPFGGRQEVKHLAVDVGFVCLFQLLPDVAGHAFNIMLKQFHILENLMVDTLQDVVELFRICCLHLISPVYQARRQRNNFPYLSNPWKL